jgi:hypothetical protein
MRLNSHGVDVDNLIPGDVYSIKPKGGVEMFATFKRSTPTGGAVFEETRCGTQETVTGDRITGTSNQWCWIAHKSSPICQMPPMIARDRFGDSCPQCEHKDYHKAAKLLPEGKSWDYRVVPGECPFSTEAPTEATKGPYVYVRGSGSIDDKIMVQLEHDKAVIATLPRHGVCSIAKGEIPPYRNTEANGPLLAASWELREALSGLVGEIEKLCLVADNLPGLAEAVKTGNEALALCMVEKKEENDE